jgi:hypothetical protein
MLSSISSVLVDPMRNSKWRTFNSEGWREMVRRCWYLGLTSFGGPAVHFQIVRNVNAPAQQDEILTPFSQNSSVDYLWKSTSG